MIADGTMPGWVAGDEVCGRAGALRAFLAEHGVGYVMRVGCAFHGELAPGTTLRTDAAVAAQLWPDGAEGI
jgi:hypothetical protein